MKPTTPNIRIDGPVLRTMFEATWSVIIQCGKKADDDKDQVIAICFREQDALKVKHALEEYL